MRQLAWELFILECFWKSDKSQVQIFIFPGLVYDAQATEFPRTLKQQQRLIHQKTTTKTTTHGVFNETLGPASVPGNEAFLANLLAHKIFSKSIKHIKINLVERHEMKSPRRSNALSRCLVLVGLGGSKWILEEKGADR